MKTLDTVRETTIMLGSVTLAFRANPPMPRPALSSRDIETDPADAHLDLLHLGELLGRCS